jgi:competence protein ComEC
MTRVRLGCAALVLWISAATFPASQSRPLDVYWIDAEGGAATLIVTPAGESILIDAGYPDERGAPRIHKVATEIAGLQRIDKLIVTHFHDDHFGGAAALQKLMPIAEVYDNGSPEPAEKITPLFEAYRAAFPKARLLNPGDRLTLQQAPATAGLTMRLLATRQQFVPAPAGAATPPACKDLTADPPDTSDNANSTAWVLQLGDFRFFDAGDLTWNAEARLVCPGDLVGPIDVYQVTHHGLGVSNNDVLLRTIAPTVAVMNNGARKGTEARTVAALKRLPSLEASYQLHKNVRDDGQNSAGDEHTANLPEQCAANYIRMRVEPDGRRYSIEIPANGHRQSYEVRRKGTR